MPVIDISSLALLGDSDTLRAGLQRIRSSSRFYPHLDSRCCGPWSRACRAKPEAPICCALCKVRRAGPTIRSDGILGAVVAEAGRERRQEQCHCCCRVEQIPLLIYLSRAANGEEGRTAGLLGTREQLSESHGHEPTVETPRLG
jgi:hypothetical protein